MNPQKYTLDKRTLDDFLCHPIIGCPLFFLIISFVFFLSFSSPGGQLSVWMESGFQKIAFFLRHLLTYFHVNSWLIRFLIDGVWSGVSSVLSFLPQTAILFFLLAFLDKTGYLARVALIMDPLFRPFGISGRSVLPILLGFGCTVPAILYAENLRNGEKTPLLLSLSFIPCSARLATILLFSTVFFPKHPTICAITLYLICCFVAFFSLLLSKPRQPLLPLVPPPPLRLPSFSLLFKEVKQKLRDFFVRAGTVVFLSCIIVDLLAMIAPDLNPVSDPRNSILAQLGNLLAPMFAPLGFHDGRLIAALLAGFFAKEAIVSTSLLLIPEGLDQLLSFPSAISFVLFSLLYTPCIATFSAIRKKTGIKQAVFCLFRSIAIAAFFSYIFYTLLRFLSK